jgi:hypothetical protein
MMATQTLVFSVSHHQFCQISGQILSCAAGGLTGQVMSEIYHSFITYDCDNRPNTIEVSTALACGVVGVLMMLWIKEFSGWLYAFTKNIFASTNILSVQRISESYVKVSREEGLGVRGVFILYCCLFVWSMVLVGVASLVGSNKVVMAGFKGFSGAMMLATVIGTVLPLTILMLEKTRDKDYKLLKLWFVVGLLAFCVYDGVSDSDSCEIRED